MKTPPGQALNGVSQIIELDPDSGGPAVKALWNLDPHVAYVGTDYVLFSVDSGDTWQWVALHLAGLVCECHMCGLDPGQWK